MTGTLITDLISTVEKVQQLGTCANLDCQYSKPHEKCDTCFSWGVLQAEKSHGPEFSHTHDCTQCGSVCHCDWADCDVNQPDTICNACAAWQEGR